MTSQDNNNSSQRFVPYRAVIPFYILYDLDLNANHLRLYGQIEQMESNPNPAVQPSFSYSWLAEQLGINRRNAINVAKLLIKKGYIEHREVSQGKYIWNTKKAVISVQDSSTGVAERHPPSVAQRHPPSVAERHPKIPEIKIPEDKRNTHGDFAKSPGVGPRSLSPLYSCSYKDDTPFMRWYSSYPKKEKPRVAWEAFCKLRPTPEFVEMLIRDVQQRIANNWRGRPKNKIPNPATYLQSREWEGEIYLSETGQQKSSQPKYKTMDDIFAGML